jgi:hypothetical protein
MLTLARCARGTSRVVRRSIGLDYFSAGHRLIGRCVCSLRCSKQLYRPPGSFKFYWVWEPYGGTIVILYPDLKRIVAKILFLVQLVLSVQRTAYYF